MVDYQGNSKKDRSRQAPEKKIEKVVVGEVAVQKKPLGRKIKDVFVEADFKTVFRYVAVDVLLPAAKNMIWDAGSKGLERTLFGDRAIRGRNFGPGPRVSYNNPIYRDREYRDPRTSPPGPTRVPRQSRNDFILTSREEANLVLERMNDIIDTYEVVSVADLNDLVGFPTSHIDNKWGWYTLGDVAVRQIREGYLIDLPPVEPIQ